MSKKKENIEINCRGNLNESKNIVLLYVENNIVKFEYCFEIYGYVTIIVTCFTKVNVF